VSSIEPTTLPNFTTTATTLARSTAQFLHGSASLSMTKITGTGTAFATYPFIGTDVDEVGIPCTAGETYSGRAAFKAGTISRTCRVTLTFFDRNNASVAATNTFQDCTDVSTEWREAFCTVVAPMGAVWVQLTVEAQAVPVAEVHFVDQLGIFPGRRVNLLTEMQASFEGGFTGWAAAANTTLTTNPGTSKRGTTAAQVAKSVSTGTARIETPGGTSGFRVNGSQQYVASFWAVGFTSIRDFRATINWFDAAGAATGSQAVGTSVTGENFFVGGQYKQAMVSATSPAGAVFAQVGLEWLSVPSGEIFFADAVYMGRGGVAADVRDIHYWNQGGFLHHEAVDHIIELQRATEVDSEGMDVWETIPEPRVVHTPMMQMLTFTDYEVPGGVTAKYRARIEALNGGDDMITSPWSAPTDTETMPAPTTWWLRDPLDENMSMPIRVVSANYTVPKPNTTDYPAGASAAVMTHDGVKDDVIHLLVDLLDETKYTLFRLMTGTGATLLLQSTHGGQWYVQADDGIDYEVMRAAKQPAEIWPTRHFHRVKIDFISVEKPRALGVAAAHHA